MSLLKDAKLAKEALEKVIDNRIDVQTRDCMRLYKAKVVTPANESTKVMGVQLIQDTAEMDLPYTKAVAKAQEGDIVWVATIYGSWRNAIVFANSDFDIGSSGIEVGDLPLEAGNEITLTPTDDNKVIISTNAVIDLDSQYVRITDLDTGIYKLTFNGSKYIYYDGATSSTYKQFDGVRPTLLYVTKKINSDDEEFWSWYVIESNGVGRFAVALWYGTTDITSGSRSQLLFQQLLTNISSYVINELTYDTSNSTYALSAYQGYVLKQAIDEINNKIGDGEAGRGIVSIVKTATNGLVDTYTITYTDNTTSTFTVTNGATGATGVGISSITKTSTSGLVDTYTITFTNNATSTFTVTNGEDGTNALVYRQLLTELTELPTVGSTVTLDDREALQIFGRLPSANEVFPLWGQLTDGSTFMAICKITSVSSLPSFTYTYNSVVNTTGATGGTGAAGEDGLDALTSNYVSTDLSALPTVGTTFGWVRSEVAQYLNRSPVVGDVIPVYGLLTDGKTSFVAICECTSTTTRPSWTFTYNNVINTTGATGAAGEGEVVQETGDSETAVMSQKAVTDELARKFGFITFSNNPNTLLQDLRTAMGTDIAMVSLTGFQTGYYFVRFAYYGGYTYNVIASNLAELYRYSFVGNITTMTFMDLFSSANKQSFQPEDGDLTAIAGLTGTSGFLKKTGENTWELVEGGATGNSISSIDKTATSGLVDTYTITYTDGSTSTFTVTNGADGTDGAEYYQYLLSSATCPETIPAEYHSGINYTKLYSSQRNIAAGDLLFAIYGTANSKGQNTLVIALTSVTASSGVGVEGNFKPLYFADGENGTQGIQGEQGNGISSITKTATEGLVDTYTITFTDGTTTTFTVTNGENATTTEVATTTTDGLMSASDVVNLQKLLDSQYDRFTVDYESIDSLEYDDDTIFWDTNLLCYHRGQSVSKPLNVQLPILAGDGIKFTPNAERTRLTISATGGGSSLTMPIIRMGSATDTNNTMEISDDNPLTFTVEVIGGELQVGDELQLCAMKLFTYANTEADDGSRIRKYKMRQFAKYTITEEDLSKRYLSIAVATDVERRELLRGGGTTTSTVHNYYTKYLRIRREHPDNPDNNAFFSNAVPFQVFGKWDKETTNSLGKVSIR